MARTYTDFTIFILRSDEHVYHQIHIKNNDGAKRLQNIPYHGHKYSFNRLRATRLKKWVPWFSIDWKHLWKTWREWSRGKKIGFLVYLEPRPPQAYYEKIPIEWRCPVCDFKGKVEHGVKTHITRMHKDEKKLPTVIYRDVKKWRTAIEPVQPLHISKLLGPQGEPILEASA